MFADQSSQEHEHAEKPNDFPHVILLLCILRQARVHNTLRRRGEGAACTAITCHGMVCTVHVSVSRCLTIFT